MAEKETVVTLDNGVGVLRVHAKVVHGGGKYWWKSAF